MEISLEYCLTFPLQVKAGALLNFLCVFTVDMATHTWAYAFFDYDTIPWANNATTETFVFS